MKPCTRNRKRIAWLVLDVLDAGDEGALRLHLETCEGCRQYRTELSALTQRVAAAKTCQELETTEAFHQKVTRAIRAQGASSGWDNLATRTRAQWKWRVALPALSAALALVAAALFFVPRQGGPLIAPTASQTGATTQNASDLPPTLANYQMVANRSLDQLDEMMSWHGSRNPAPIPIYTAMPVRRAQEWD